MQTLACEITVTFIDDAAALAAGFGRIVVRLLMAPVERLAIACDVAGVLARRRARPALNRRMPRSHQPRWRLRNCIFSFRFLRDLT